MVPKRRTAADNPNSRGDLVAISIGAYPMQVTDADLLARIVVNPAIFGGKPIIRGHRLAVEHVLGMLAAGDDIPTILEGYAWLEREDVLACIEYARRLVGHERIEPLHIGKKSA